MLSSESAALLAGSVRGKFMSSLFAQSERRAARHLAIAGALVAAAGLIGAAVASRGPAELPPKWSARVPAIVAQARTPEPFAPRVDVAEAAPSALKAGLHWTAPEARVALTAVQPAPVVAEAKPAPRGSVAAAPLPPRRPANLVAQAPAAPEGPPVIVASDEPRARILSFELPRFAPTGAALLRRIGDVGSSVGAMGSSLGRLMRMSSR
jgi:hypothetical protein